MTPFRKARMKATCNVQITKACTIKLFKQYLIKVFVMLSNFRPSLIFVGKDGAYPSGATETHSEGKPVKIGSYRNCQTHQFTIVRNQLQQ
jgi:hypothetical protein